MSRSRTLRLRVSLSWVGLALALVLSGSLAVATDGSEASPSLRPSFTGLERLRNFKRKFLTAMRQVLVLYPAARVEQVRGGLLLKPSPSHVKRQLEA